MKKFRKILRATLLTLLLAAVVLPTALYLVLATPWAQDFIRREASEQLSSLLGTRVEIDRVLYRPFNTISITGVHIDDPAGHPALEAAGIHARFELMHLLRTGRFVVDYAVIEAPSLALSRPAPDAPLNIDPILQRLKSDRKDSKPAAFDLKIGTAIISRGRLTYNVLSEPHLAAGLDRNHIEVTDFNLYAYLRHITADTYDAEIESLSLRERSGLEITDFHADAGVSPGLLDVRSLGLRLPGSALELSPMKLPIDGYGKILQALRTTAVEVATRREARVALRDLAWAVPSLASSDRVVNFSFDVRGTLSDIDLRSLRLADNRDLRLSAAGSASHITSPDSLSFELQSFSLNSTGTELARFVEPFSSKGAAYVARCGATTLQAQARGSLSDIDGRINLTAAGSSATIDGSLSRADARSRRFTASGDVELAGLNPGQIIGQPKLGPATLTASGEASFGDGAPLDAHFAAQVASLMLQGYNYTDLTLEGTFKGSDITASLRSTDPNAAVTAKLSGSLDRPLRSLDLQATVESFTPGALHLAEAWPYTVNGLIDINLEGTDLDDVQGHVHLADVNFAPAAGSEAEPLTFKQFDIDIDRSRLPERLTLTSDVVNGAIEGSFNPSTLGGALRDMAAHIVPALIAHDDDEHLRTSAPEAGNDFTFSLTVANAEALSRFLRLPVQIIYPVTLDGVISSTEGSAYVTLDAPYLQQGDKIIESTVAHAAVDARDDRASVYATTKFPTKKGPMTAVVDVQGADNRFDTDIDWTIERRIPLNGKIDFSTELGRGDDRRICTDTHFNPGAITFGDDVWRINPSNLTWCNGCLTARDFALTAADQSIAIEGVAGPAASDSLTVQLHNIQLASIFETLEIDKALIGGRATGTFTAAQALSGIPLLATENLHVDGIGYNYCTLGDADIKAHFDTDRKSFFLDADIVNPEGQHSRIWGDIFAASEALDLNFDADNVKVGFMKPFMEAFASDVEGYVSGKARLFGTFKDIDMEGDIFARDLHLKIDFTNTWYSATDSIHVRPGLIDLQDITIRDIDGHTAMLNGWLRHDYFHNPTFDFRITDARDFLSYNVTERLNPDWYGTVCGTGGANITGKPGVVEIGVNMRTAPNSVFTFVLSDRLEAEQYSFISFRDRTEITVADTLMMVPDDIPAAVKDFQARMRVQNTDEPSQYLMDIRVDITPDAQMILVMDPVGGDRIKANGAGDLRMTYNSADNDLRMYGTYTLERGSYNFTLQDIIIKDFTIDRGSSITFRGDPYSAQLDIDAVYSVNANLSDLDESFLQDKDLNRTTVPVEALLKVTGDMRQPDISFDLRFPTLQSDIYRKVRSIISTDEMMNRQIIYLLALNRFYTPDYMQATRGSELFSVASSTISSQLSNMLGKLSDNWSIAPNLRSDRGDFSDVEVDVALSSRLLNNRLLFNGNFGYRDHSLNTNQFIGDFDIEYLLNPRGTWRLKAYNRYNDQNYYLRSAATTQGVGIIVRRDFDNLFSFLRRKKKEAPDKSDKSDQSDKSDKSDKSDQSSQPANQ